MRSEAMDPANDRTAPWHGLRGRRAVDRLLAVACYPLAVLLTVAPGGLHELDDAAGTGSTISGLLFRWFPGVLRDGAYGPLLAVEHWGVALAAFAVVPGAVSWSVLRRRDRPEWLLGVAVALLLLITNIVPVAVALYSYAAWFGDRRRLAVWTAVALVAFAVGLSGTTVTWSVLTMVLVAFVTPLSLGLWTSTRRRLVESLHERAARLEAEQRLLAERATIAERTRTARDARRRRPPGQPHGPARRRHRTVRRGSGARPVGGADQRDRQGGALRAT
jgi:hypothetical protein